MEDIVSGKSVISKEIPTPGCAIKRPTIKKVFWSDVAPIILKKCVNCHDPFKEAPINYSSYEDVVGRLAMFRHVIENDLMPPWHLDPNTGPWKNDLSLTVKEKATLLKWIDEGAKADKNSIKKLYKKESTGKNSSFKKTSSPDFVISLPEKVIVSPGKIEYKRFFIKTNFKEDKWIKNVSFKIKQKVIHHSFFLILDPSFKERKVNYKYALNRVTPAFPGMLSNKIGVKIPKGSTLMWETHYEPLGQKVIDENSHIQITFHKKQPKYKIVSFTLVFKKINIPPYKSDYQTKMSYKIKEDLFVMGMSSHMHLRGKAGSIFIRNSQKKKRVFGINPWNVKFEKSYLLKKPLRISKNSTIECINYFDNSENNVWNPFPEKYVTTGDYIEDEMSWCRLILLYPSSSKVTMKHIRFK
ncbi:MAG: hypothetical protein OXB86_06100 [Bdellovibrionales bacterium]|nr:hypothetical protein [Bdellovibrionales bacterium]